MKIDLYITPTPFGKVEIENKTVVVVDVLRASTSICAALSSGARAVIPTDGRGKAGEMWTKIGSGNAVLAGEIDGKKIENFQLGNSPLEFTEKTVKDKFVIMTTTNGTPVFNKTYTTATVICGALVNITEIFKRIIAEKKDLIIVCSGKDSQFSIEDTICGGMLINLIIDRFDNQINLNDAGRLAALLYETNKNMINSAIRQGEHARYLKSIGFEADIDFATNIDSLPIVPVLKDGQLIIDN